MTLRIDVLAIVCLMTVMGFAANALAQWQAIPWISAEIRAAGVTVGGEGAQMVRAIAIDATDGKFVLFGTDVGGLFRSLDGGKTWEPCNVGYFPRGTCGMAIDPHNPQRVLSVGANSVAYNHHGIWLSTDQAGSWRNVLPLNMSGSKDRREQLAFDPNTFDPVANLTTDVYWSRIDDDKPMWRTVESVPALYKSTDGGETWTQLPDTAHVAGGIVKVHPTRRGLVYIANRTGVWRSEDAAKSFVKVWEGHATGLDVSKAAPDSVWVTSPEAVLHSPDAGDTWKTVGATELKRDGYALRHIKVSPVSASNMVMWRDHLAGYDESWYYSRDGGKTWHRSVHDARLAFLPLNERWSHPAWHPLQADTLINNGGDWPTRSTDGGATYAWSASGQTAVLVGGSFTFNPRHPDIVMAGSQDYNGAVTHDGGFTWKYLNISGKRWGGHSYGGYAISPTSLVTNESQSWGGPRQVAVSHDGGRSWQKIEGALFANNPASGDATPRGLAVAMGDPLNEKIVFSGPYRSTDGGKTWHVMPRIMGVLAVCEKPYRLFASGLLEDGKTMAVYQSINGGADWAVLVQAEAYDLAFDASRDRLYLAQREKGLAVWNRHSGKVMTLDVPKDQHQSWRVRSVALDPVNPDIVYVAQNKDQYSSSVSVTRSLDAGKTWQVLTMQQPLDGQLRDGGRESFWVRVHPTTREPWFITGCYGMWKYQAP